MINNNKAKFETHSFIINYCSPQVIKKSSKSLENKGFPLFLYTVSRKSIFVLALYKGKNKEKYIRMECKTGETP